MTFAGCPSRCKRSRAPRAPHEPRDHFATPSVRLIEGHPTPSVALLSGSLGEAERRHPRSALQSLRLTVVSTRDLSAEPGILERARCDDRNSRLNRHSKGITPGPITWGRTRERLGGSPLWGDLADSSVDALDLGSTGFILQLSILGPVSIFPVAGSPKVLGEHR